MTDQPLTDRPGTADEPLATPPLNVADEPMVPILGPNEPGAEIDYSLPPKIEIAPDGFPMKQVYKFFQLAILNEREGQQFNEEFEGWTVAGMATHGARVVILGTKFVPVVEVVEEEVVEEEADPGMLDDEIEEREASNTPPTKRTKVIDPFRK